MPKLPTGEHRPEVLKALDRLKEKVAKGIMKKKDGSGGATKAQSKKPAGTAVASAKGKSFASVMENLDDDDEQELQRVIAEKRAQLAAARRAKVEAEERKKRAEEEERRKKLEEEEKAKKAEAEKAKKAAEQKKKVTASERKKEAAKNVKDNLKKLESRSQKKRNADAKKKKAVEKNKKNFTSESRLVHYVDPETVTKEVAELADLCVTHELEDGNVTEAELTKLERQATKVCRNGAIISRLICNNI